MSSMETIYLSQRARVAVGTFFIKIPGMKHTKFIRDKYMKTGA